MFHTSRSHGLTVAAGSLALAVLVFVVNSAPNTDAATAPGLGTASSYAVLGGQTVTNTGPTTINGDLGVSPGTAVTNFPPGIVTNGSIHSADANALQAQNDVTTAYNALAAQPCTADLTGQDLGGLTLTAGVYCFSSSAQLTGQLTLNAQGSANAVFVFKMVSTLTTASNSSVLVTNGSTGCNVFWQVGSSATIGTGTVFVGNILALTSISLTTAASVSGRALARNGAVTMDSNHVGFEACAVPTATPTAAPTPTATVTPSPTPVGETASPTPATTPVGQTPSPTPVGQTPSPIPTPTPVGQTPSPTPSSTPIGQTATATPSPTPRAMLPPPAAPTNTPSPTPGIHFPNTGGPPPQGSLPWMLLLLGVALSSLGATAFVLSRLGRRLGAQKAGR